MFLAVGFRKVNMLFVGEGSIQIGAIGKGEWSSGTFTSSERNQHE